MAVGGARIGLHAHGFGDLEAQLGGRGRTSCLGLRSRLPRQATSVPPIRSSGAAYSATTASGASARAVTRSNLPSPSGHCSARALTTVAFVSPAACDRPFDERALATVALHQRDARASGRAIASGRPGKPAPEPRSAIDRPRGPHAAKLERHQRVGQMVVDGRRRVADRCRGPDREPE